MIEEIKLLLGINDDLQDHLLDLLITDSEERILSTLNSFALKNGTEKLSTIPETLAYVKRDVIIKRFNKINSEGTTADSEEGRSYTWEKSYLDEYLTVFDEITKPENRAGRGITRFI
ncbi:TPA: phage head-tail connector protein [Enterococcus faecium]